MEDASIPTMFLRYLAALFIALSLPALAQTPSMNFMTLHYAHWPDPAPTFIRTNAGERWYLIETAQGTYSPTFGNLNQWIATAKREHAQLVYTFNTVPKWATGTNNLADPPSDLHATNEKCQAPISAVSPNGDCYWKEWVTKLMQYVCHANAQPSSPLSGRCDIRYFESWNEMNSDSYWRGSYADLAKMANDASTIIHAYCGDCYVIGGSVSAGGDGYHAGPAARAYDVALGQFLDAWHAIPGAHLPDAVSYHSYPSRTNVRPAPFPETLKSNGDARCSGASNVFCQVPIIKQTGVLRSALGSHSWAANLPIWETEGGWGPNASMIDGKDPNSAATWRLRQAFVARWLIALASTGTQEILWFQYDNPCWGTMLSTSDPTSKAGCPNDPDIPLGPTPARAAWKQTVAWLQGATFPHGCTHAGDIWTCDIARQDGSSGRLVWSGSDGSAQAATSYALPRQGAFASFADLDGNTQPLTSGNVPISIRPVLLLNSGGASAPRPRR